MRRLLAGIFLFTVLSTCLASAQTWEYFWHPKHISQTEAFGATVPAFEWMFKPTFNINATWIRPSTIGGKTDYEILSAAGPALTLQHTGVLADGSNYADYSANLVLFISGGTDTAPFIKPAVGLAIGVFNNIIEVGGGYDLVKREDGLSRFFFLVSVGINLTNN